MRKFVARLILLSLVAFIMPACHDDSQGLTPPPVPAGNQAPVFQGLTSIATVGGGTVFLSWAAANDDIDAPASIRYQVFSSAASGGQVFTSPLMTTAAGATSASVAGTVGTETFYVVRAVDSAGLSDANTVELSVVPLSAAALIFVDDSVAGPGTGTFADPFNLIQAGVVAGEALAGGAIILVASGVYNEAVLISAVGTSPITVIGGFPDWATFGGTQPSADVLLDAYDPTANATTVSGTGITQFTGFARGLIHVANSGRPTTVQGLSVADAEVVAIFGVDVNLQITGCFISDPAAGNVTEIGIKLETSAVTVDNTAAIVGNDIRQFSQGATLNRGVGVEFGGSTARLTISSNFIGQAQSSSFSSTGISTDTSLFAVTDTSSAVVPTGVTTRIRIENNRIFRTNSGGITLDFESEAPASAGSLDVTIIGNRIESIQSGDWIEIDDLMFFGAGGTGTLTIANNRVLSTNQDSLNVDYYDTLSTATAPNGPTTLLVENNWFIQSDSEHIELRDFAPPAGGTASITIRNNQAAISEGDGFDMDALNVGVAGPADGRLVVEIKDNVFNNIDDARAVECNDFGNPPGALGLLSVTIQGNSINVVGSTPVIQVDLDQIMGTDPAGTPYNQTAVVKDNILIDSINSGSSYFEIRLMVRNGVTSSDISSNTIEGSAGGINFTMNDTGDVSGPVGVASLAVSSNSIKSLGSGGTALQVDIDVTGQGATVLDVLNNRVSADSQAISVEVFSGAAGPNGRAYLNLFNNRIDGSDSNDQLEYDDNTNSASGEASFALVMNNTIGFGNESSGTYIDSPEHGIVLFANNVVSYGEVDSNDGLRLYKSHNSPGNLIVRNNLILFNPGDGVSFNNSDMTPQLINNTIAYNSQGGSSSNGGIDSISSSPFSQAHVQNCILYLNGGFDLDQNELLRASYSLVGDQNPPTGFGNITGDPLFALTGTIFDFMEAYQLRLGSAAINAGNPATRFNDPDGSRNNMGAFGGPGSAVIGSTLPVSLHPVLPMVALGINKAVGVAPSLPGQVHLYAGALLTAFDGANPVQIVFSKPVDPLTVAGGLVFSVGGTGIAGTATPLDGGRRISFTPTAPVPAGSVVTVNASSALAATDGTSLAIPFVTTFGVAPIPVAEIEIATPDSNGTAGTAEVIAGTPAVLQINGTMFDETDPADVYSFTGTAGQRFQITVGGDRIGTPSASANFMLEILDATGVIVHSANQGTSGVVGTSPEDPFIDFTIPATGTYLLRVTAAMAVGGPYAYQLHWFRE